MKHFREKEVRPDIDMMFPEWFDWLYRKHESEYYARREDLAEDYLAIYPSFEDLNGISILSLFKTLEKKVAKEYLPAKGTSVEVQYKIKELWINNNDMKWWKFPLTKQAWADAEKGLSDEDNKLIAYSIIMDTSNLNKSELELADAYN